MENDCPFVYILCIFFEKIEQK